MKSAAVRDLAEKMYVLEGRTYKDIAIILDVTEKTAWSWGQPGAGNWEEKRANFLKSKTESYEGQYKMLNTVLSRIQSCLDQNVIPDQRLISLYNRLTDGMRKTKEFEDGMRQAEKKAGDKKEGLSQETIDKIESEMKLL